MSDIVSISQQILRGTCDFLLTSYLLQSDDASSPVRPVATPRSVMTSPVQDFEPFEDESELLGDISQAEQPEEEEGEELFGDNMEKYASCS